MRMLFRKGQIGTRVDFLFDHVGIVEASHDGSGLDLEEAAIVAGAQNVEALEHVAEDHSGGRFLTDPKDLDTVTKALREGGWSVTLSEMGYVPKEKLTLSPEHRAEVEEFLAAVDDFDDVHRIYAAL
jgi:transcriptional/translational regulatory protein YebC/TACO1